MIQQFCAYTVQLLISRQIDKWLSATLEQFRDIFEKTLRLKFFNTSVKITRVFQNSHYRHMVFPVAKHTWTAEAGLLWHPSRLVRQKDPSSLTRPWVKSRSQQHLVTLKSRSAQKKEEFASITSMCYKCNTIFILDIRYLVNFTTKRFFAVHTSLNKK